MRRKRLSDRKMQKTKVTVVCFYILQLILILIMVFANIEMESVEFGVGCLINIAICDFVNTKVLMRELKEYSPKIYEVLYRDDGYVHGFLWVSYAFGSRAYDPEKDKNVKACMKAQMLLVVIIFGEMVVFNMVRWV